MTQRLILLLGIALAGLAPVHAQFTTPGLQKALTGQQAKAMHAKFMMSAKQVGVAMAMFDVDHGALPGEKTVKPVGEAADDGVKVAAASANDCFFQLVVGGYVDDPGLFSPDRKDQQRNNVGLKKLEHCFFSYIPAKTLGVPVRRPLVVAPLVKGKTTFDPKPLSGKALVMFSDISVQMFDIDADGRVMINGKDLFDPKQGYWQGKPPVVKWPE